MSLQYQKEETPESREAEAEAKNLRQANSIFPLYSVILIASVAAVWVCQVSVDGLDSAVYGGNTSVVLAGFVKQLFWKGQYWRILTGAALHSGIMHLAFNCYALYVLGRIIEMLSNRAHLAIIFLLSAIGGGILSLLFLPQTPSVGASGGIVGFLGYLTVYGYQRRKLLTNGFLKNMLINVGIIAFTGIFILPNVDNYGHLGGFIVGAVYGFLQIPKDLYADPRETSETVKLIGIAALAVFIITCIFSILVMLGIIPVTISNLGFDA